MSVCKAWPGSGRPDLPFSPAASSTTHAYCRAAEESGPINEFVALGEHARSCAVGPDLLTDGVVNSVLRGLNFNHTGKKLTFEDIHHKEKQGCFCLARKYFVISWGKKIEI